MLTSESDSRLQDLPVRQHSSHVPARIINNQLRSDMATEFLKVDSLPLSMLSIRSISNERHVSTQYHFWWCFFW